MNWAIKDFVVVLQRFAKDRVEQSGGKPERRNTPGAFVPGRSWPAAASKK
jgi:hypothetical protein